MLAQASPEEQLMINMPMGNPAIARQLQNAGAPQPAVAPAPKKVAAVPGVKTMVSQSVTTKGPGEGTDLDRQIQELYAANIKDVQSGNAALQGTVDEAKKREYGGFKDLNLAPLMGLADAWGGSNLAQTYKAPQTQDERQAQIMALEEMLRKGKREANSGLLDYLKMRQDAHTKTERNQAYVAGLQARNAMLAAGLGLRDDKLAASLGKELENDPIIKNQLERRQQIAMDIHTLQTAPAITPQMWAELQKGVANAITGARSATVSDTEAMKINTLAIEWANLQQKLTNSPQDIESPEMRKYLSDLLARLDDAYRINISARTDQKMAGMENLSSTKAKKVLGDKAKNLKDTKPAGSHSMMSAEDQAALEWAKSNPDDPLAQQWLMEHGE